MGNSRAPFDTSNIDPVPCTDFPSIGWNSDLIEGGSKNFKDLVTDDSSYPDCVVEDDSQSGAGFAELVSRAAIGDAAALETVASSLFESVSDSDIGRQVLKVLAARVGSDRTAGTALIELSKRGPEERNRVLESLNREFLCEKNPRILKVELLPTLAAIAVDNKELLSKGPTEILDALNKAGGEGNKSAVELLARVALGKPAGASATAFDTAVSELAKQAAKSLQDLAPRIGHEKVLATAATVYGKLAPDSVVNPEQSFLLNAITNIYSSRHTRSDRSPAPQKGSLLSLHRMLASLNLTSEIRSTGSSSYLNAELAPLLAKLSTGAVDEKSARLSSDKLARMWLKESDRVTVFNDVKDALTRHGDRFGFAALAIESLAFTDMNVDSSSFNSLRRQIQTDSRNLFDKAAGERGARFASRHPNDSARGDDLKEHFRLQNSRESMDHRMSRNDGPVPVVVPEAVLSAIPSLSPGTQDVLHSLSPLLRELVKSQDHTKTAGKGDFDKLIELSDALKGQVVLPDEYRSALKRFLGDNLAKVLGPGKLAHVLVDGLPTMPKRPRSLAFDMVRLAQRLETPEGARRATPDEVRALAAFCIDTVHDSCACRPFASVMRYASDEESKKLAYEYNRSFGWKPDSADDEFVKESVQSYAKDYLKKNAGDHQFIHDTSRLVDIEQKLPLRVLLSQLGIDHRSEEIEKKLESAIRKAGEQRVRQAIANFVAWQSLDPVLRGALIHGREKQESPTYEEYLRGKKLVEAFDPKRRPSWLFPSSGADLKVGSSFQKSDESARRDSPNPFDQTGLIGIKLDQQEAKLADKSKQYFVSTKDVLGLLSEKGNGHSVDINGILTALAGDRKKDGSSNIVDVADLVASSSFSSRLHVVARYFESGKDLVKQYLEMETKHLELGMKALVKTASTGPGFFDGSKFEKDHTDNTRNVSIATYMTRGYARELAQFDQHLRRLDLSNRVRDYTEHVSEGRRSAADNAAIDMAKKYGFLSLNAFAPTVFANIFGMDPNLQAPLRSAADSGLIGRLQRAGDRAELLPFPAFKCRTEDVWVQGLAVLSKVNRGDSVLAQPIRESAVEAMNTDPRFTSLMDRLGSLTEVLQEFKALFPIGSDGKRSEGFTDHMRQTGYSLVRNLDELTSRANRKHVVDLLGTLKDAKHPELNSIMSSLEAIKSLQDDYVTPEDGCANEKGKLQTMLEHVKSERYDSNNWDNWIKNDAGYILLEAAVTAGLMAASGGVGGTVRAATWGGKIVQGLVHAGRLTVSMAVADGAVRELKYHTGRDSKGQVIGDATRSALYGTTYHIDDSGCLRLSPTFSQALHDTGDHLRKSFDMNLRLLGFGAVTRGVLQRMTPGMTETLRQLETVQNSLTKAPGRAQLVSQFVSEFTSFNKTNAMQSTMAAFLQHQFGLDVDNAGHVAGYLLAAKDGYKGHRATQKALDNKLSIAHTGSSTEVAEFLRKQGRTVNLKEGQYYLKEGNLEIKLVEIPVGREIARNDTARAPDKFYEWLRSVVNSHGAEVELHSAVGKKGPDKIEGWNRAFKEYSSTWTDNAILEGELARYWEAGTKLLIALEKRAAELKTPTNTIEDAHKSAYREAQRGMGKHGEALVAFNETSRDIEAHGLSRMLGLSPEHVLNVETTKNEYNKLLHERVKELTNEHHSAKDAHSIALTETGTRVADARDALARCVVRVGGPDIAAQIRTTLRERPLEVLMLSRVRSLNALLGRLAHLADVPPWRTSIVTMDVTKEVGYYVPGVGTMTLNSHYLASREGAMMLRKIAAHEAVHYEQDILTIRALGQELRDKGVDVTSSEGLKQLQVSYFNATGYDLDPAFCNRIFGYKRFRNTRLTPAEISHARELAAALKEFKIDDLKMLDQTSTVRSEAERVHKAASAKDLVDWIDGAVARDRLNYWFGTNDKKWLLRLKERLESDPNSFETARGELFLKMRAHEIQLEQAGYDRYLNRIHERLARVESDENEPSIGAGHLGLRSILGLLWR